MNKKLFLNACKNIAKYKNIVKKTPLEFNQRLSEKYNNNIFFKREDLQNTRSFKIRGALNKILNNENSTKLVTCSAGNHAQGVALVSNMLDIDVDIFVPNITPKQKIDRIKYYGKDNINLNLVGNNFTECMNYSLKYCEDNNYSFIHPFDDINVIAGQSTIVKEIIEEKSDIDYIVVPVGGGGLISGLTYINEIIKERNIKIIGVEPKGANSLEKSLDKKRRVNIDDLDTFVDGASVNCIGEINFDICRENIYDVFSVDNNKLCKHIVDLYNYEGILTEPAGALSVSSLDELVNKYELKGKNIISLISGGNNDMLRYSEIYERKLKYDKLVYYYDINFVQKSGELKKFMNQKYFKHIDIIEFNYKKYNNNVYAPVKIGIQIEKKEDIYKFENYLNENNIQFTAVSE
jgi:threonine dehydratase